MEAYATHKHYEMVLMTIKRRREGDKLSHMSH